jgi:hypothetical protein
MADLHAKKGAPGSDGSQVSRITFQFRQRSMTNLKKKFKVKNCVTIKISETVMWGRNKNWLTNLFLQTGKIDKKL